jgi:lipid-binding SYLF domain-containing protein
MRSENRWAGWSCALALAGALALPFASGANAASANSKDKAAAEKMTPEAKEAERAARRKLADEALQKLYEVEPEARKAVEGAAGYAVFDITSIYALVFVGQKGKGVMFDNATKKATYMISSRAGTGPGVGKQRVFQIFVFKSKGAMEQFIAVGGLGGDVSATYSAGKAGAVRSFNPTIDIYQIPESGIAVQASWGGTVYKVDGDLK